MTCVQPEMIPFNQRWFPSVFRTPFYAVPLGSAVDLYHDFAGSQICSIGKIVGIEVPMVSIERRLPGT